MREQEITPPPPAQRPMLPPSAEASSGRSLSKYRAVVISLLMAGGAMLASRVVAEISPMLVFFVLLAAGFFAAVLYGKQTRTRLSAAGGAFVGWLTGLWLFLLFVGVFVSPQGADAMRQMQSLPQFSQLMAQNPHQVIAIMVFSGFCMLTFIPGIGGMMAASLTGKGRQPS
jgi:hypothetical protein